MRRQGWSFEYWTYTNEKIENGNLKTNSTDQNKKEKEEEKTSIVVNLTNFKKMS